MSQLIVENYRQVAQDIAKQQSPPQVAASQVCKHAGVRKLGMTHDPVVSSISTVDLICLKSPSETQSICSSDEIQKIKTNKTIKNQKLKTNKTSENTTLKTELNLSTIINSGDPKENLLKDSKDKANDELNLFSSQKNNILINQPKIVKCQPSEVIVNTSNTNEEDSMISTKINSIVESEKKCFVM